MAQLAENKGKNISKEQLKTILNKYFEDIETLELPDDLTNSNIKLTANQTYGGYTNIALSDIYNGILRNEDVTSTNESEKIFTALNGKSYWDIAGNSSIEIDSNTTAKFYDDSLNNTPEAYIAYSGKIYKVTYPNDIINGVYLTNIDINSLGVSGSNFTTIVLGTMSSENFYDHNGEFTDRAGFFRKYNYIKNSCKTIPICDIIRQNLINKKAFIFTNKGANLSEATGSIYK